MLITGCNRIFMLTMQQNQQNQQTPTFLRPLLEDLAKSGALLGAGGAAQVLRLERPGVHVDEVLGTLDGCKYVVQRL